MDHQYFEMAKAVINQSSEYRLSQEAAYLPVPIELWYTWSKIRRNKYINYIRNLSKSDLEDHQTLKTDMWYYKSDLSSVKKALSLKLPELLPNIPHADIIEEKALDLLNIPNAITLSLQLSLLPISSRSSSSLTYPFNAGGAGSKGDQKRRERKFQQEEIHTSNQLFSEIWHSNEPFEIALVKNIPIEKNFCNYC